MTAERRQSKCCRVRFVDGPHAIDIRLKPDVRHYGRPIPGAQRLDTRQNRVPAVCG